MNRAAIERVIRSQGHTPRFQRLNERVERVWAVNGNASRSIGYLSSLQQMEQDKLESWIKASFERRAR